MVMISEFEPVFGCDLADLVEIVCHLLDPCLGVFRTIARYYEIFAAAGLLYFEELAPVLHDLGLSGRVFLNA